VARHSPSRDSHAYRDLQRRFIQNLRRIRIELGLTQEQLAERCGWDSQRIQQLEHPDTANPTLRSVARVSQGLGIDPLVLFQAPPKEKR